MSFSPLAKDIILANANEAYIRCELRRRAEAYALLKQLQEERVSATANSIISSPIIRPSSSQPDSVQQAVIIGESPSEEFTREALRNSGYKLP